MAKHRRPSGRHRAPSHTGVVAARTATAGAVAFGTLASTATSQAATGMPPDVRAAVIACESGGDPAAQNDHSTASGLYQFVDGTWRRFGGSTPRAKDAPAAEQHRVADRTYAANGLADWEASRQCWQNKIGKHASGREAPAVREVRTAGPRHARTGAAPTGGIYVVKRGDTLSSIAAAHHTTWRRLYAANCGTVTDPNRIFPGERLHV